MQTPSHHGSPLPVALAPFLGRGPELEQILALLRTTRLLTLTGSGGSGKTRLALELARQLSVRAPGSARWVEFASLVNGDLMAQHMAGQLSAIEQPSRSTVDVLLDCLGDAHWLVLDNCEHVIDAAAELAGTLLQRCAHLTIIATSREALGIDGERAWLVRGLATESTSPADGGSDALQFFVDRARAGSPSFEPSPEHVGAIEQICRRLDGIPLALELAAARVAVLTPAQIAERLDDAFRLLVAQKRTALPRHRTLAAAVEWSYRLIPAAEQALLQRLSVFAGPFSLEAAEFVCAGEGIAAPDILDLLSGLVRRSLLNVQHNSDAVRYSLLEIIRQFAQEQRRVHGNATELESRHARFYASLCSTALPYLEESDSRAWRHRLTAEYADIRAALYWAFRGGDPRVGHRLVASLWWYWGLTWRISEWRYWADEALRHEPTVEDQAWGQAMHGAGTLSYLSGDFERGRAWLQSAAEILARTGDPVHESMARASLSNLEWNAGRLEDAFEQGQLAAEIARSLPEFWPLCHALADGLGPVLVERGEFERADACFREAAERSHRPGAPGPAFVVVARARAALALDLNRIDEAVSHFLPACARAGQIDDPHTMFRLVLVLGRLLVGQGQYEDAARLLGTMAVSMERGMPLLRFERSQLRALLESTRAALGDDRFEAHHAEGRGDTVAGVLARGYETLSRLATSPANPSVSIVTPALHIRTLGGFESTLGGQPCLAGARQSKIVELLVYMLCHRGGRTREQIGVALWPDASTAQVKNNFHVLLHKLRRNLGDEDWVVMQGERYRLAEDLPIWFDVTEFERRMEPGSSARREPIDLEGALKLYRGPFMEGGSLGEWGIEIRERLQRTFVEGMSRFADGQIEAGDVAGAAATLEQLLRVDDLREDACRRLMECLDRIGLRDQALRHYRELVERLRSELGVEPECSTRLLARQLQAPRTT